MTNNSSSTMEVPQAKDAMDKFKMEVASEIGVNLKQGYNGDLTSAQAGSIGGEMVRRMISVRKNRWPRRYAVTESHNPLAAIHNQPPQAAFADCS